MRHVSKRDYQPLPAWVRLASCAVGLAFGLGLARGLPAGEPDLVPPPEPQSASDVPSGEPASAPSLDDVLLDDALLDDMLLDDAMPEETTDVRRSPGAAQTRSDAAGATNEKTPAEEARPDVDDSTPAEPSDPLVYISRQMRQVKELVPRAERRAHAEQLQQRIVDDLARLIAQAETQRAQQSQDNRESKSQQSTQQRQEVKQPRQTQGNAGQDANSPAEDGSNRLGKAEAARPDPELFKQMMKDTWGHLPPRDREQMLQTTPDKFLPQYELLIEKYYQRLAEEPR